MYWIYAHVRNQEKQMRKYAGSVTEDSKKQMANHTRIKNQAFMYVGAVLVTWLFPTLFQLVIVIAGKFPYPLLLLTAIFVPIQGLLNLIVFIRPKFIRYRREDPDTNALVAWFQMLYLEITGNAQRASMTTTRLTSNVEAQGTGQKRRPPSDLMKTFRLSGMKPTSSFNASEIAVEVNKGDEEEEKQPEDASAHGDDFEENPAEAKEPVDQSPEP